MRGTVPRAAGQQWAVPGVRPKGSPHGSMNKITGFSVLTTGEGERVTLSYSVLDADGNIVSTNNRKNYVVLDEDVLTAIAAIRTDAAAHLEG